MSLLTWSAVVMGWCISIAGAIELCRAIELRNQAESQRELFGIYPDKAPWP